MTTDRFLPPSTALREPVTQRDVLNSIDRLEKSFQERLQRAEAYGEMKHVALLAEVGEKNRLSSQLYDAKAQIERVTKQRDTLGTALAEVLQAIDSYEDEARERLPAALANARRVLDELSDTTPTGSGVAALHEAKRQFDIDAALSDTAGPERGER